MKLHPKTDPASKKHSALIRCETWFRGHNGPVREQVVWEIDS